MHHITRHVLGLGTGFPGARRFRQLLSVDIHKASDPLALLDQAGELLEGRYGFVVAGEEYLEDDIPHIGMRRS